MPRATRTLRATPQEPTSLIAASSHFSLGPTGLTVSGTPAFDHWQAYFDSMMLVSNASMWGIGDAIVYGEDRNDWGEMYAQAIDLTRRSYATLSNAASVCRKFEHDRRRVTLSFTHHAEVAGLPIEQQEAMLDEAERSQLSARDLRERVKELRDAANASLRAVDDGGERESASVSDPQQVRLIVTCPDEGAATMITIAAQEAGALVERVTA